MDRADLLRIREVLLTSAVSIVNSNVPGEQWPFMWDLKQSNALLEELAAKEGIKKAIPPFTINDVTSRAEYLGDTAVKKDEDPNDGIRRVLRPDLYGEDGIYDRSLDPELKKRIS